MLFTYHNEISIPARVRTYQGQGLEQGVSEGQGWSIDVLTSLAGARGEYIGEIVPSYIILHAKAFQGFQEQRLCRG